MGREISGDSDTPFPLVPVGNYTRLELGPKSALRDGRRGRFFKIPRRSVTCGTYDDVSAGGSKRTPVFRARAEAGPSGQWMGVRIHGLKPVFFFLRQGHVTTGPSDQPGFTLRLPTQLYA